MKRGGFFIVLVAVSMTFLINLSAVENQSSNNWVDPLEFIDTRIGTKGGYQYGRTVPSVTPPFGMTHWMASTRESRLSVAPYKYNDKQIIGFLGSHKPAVWMAEYGQISIIPQISKEVKVLPKDRSFGFNHKNEVALPWYYSVELEQDGYTLLAELTSTQHCGYLRFTFPSDVPAVRILAETSRVAGFMGEGRIDSDVGKIFGKNPDSNPTGIGPEMPNFSGYHVVDFKNGFSDTGAWSGSSISPGDTSSTGERCGVYADFTDNDNLSSSGQSIIEIRIATSFISHSQAQSHLSNEISQWDFNLTKQKCKAEWEKRLNRIQIKTENKEQALIFYTGMYHTLLYPRNITEEGRYYSPYDGEVHQGSSYTDYSLWDTFRAMHPLLHFTAPDHVSPMVQSLLQNYQEGGWMPKWPNPAYSNIMIGTHADSVVADAWINGFRDYDPQLAWAAVQKDCFTPPDNDLNNMWKDRAKWKGYEGRAGLSWYMKNGWVACDKTKESVARTLEFAYDDYCAARLAEALGKKEQAEILYKRSKNYQNVYRPAFNQMSSRRSDGSWNSNIFEGFTEGLPVTYAFCVMQDVPGMIDLYGGEKKFNRKLKSCFNGLYVHENEPGHHYAYLFSYSNRLDLTQKMVRRYMNSKYRPIPWGLNGDDDCGQMSAWYIFSALGFYPVCPSSGEYTVGIPLFEQARVNVSRVDGVENYLTISMDNYRAEKDSANQLSFDGEEIEMKTLSAEKLFAGGELIFSDSE